MSNYLVTDTELTSVANAIRTKGETSSPLSFPSGFISAINDISGGGGTSQWEEINCNGSGFNLWDCWVIIDQSGNNMGAGCSVTVAGITRTNNSESKEYYHFYNIPLDAQISWYGAGDDIHFAWAKLDHWVDASSSYGTTNTSTTAKISHNASGTMMLLVASPET